MGEPDLVFTQNGEVVVNFGVHAGREVTHAEVDRLGSTLLGELESFEIISERRVGFSAERGVELHRVRIELEDGAAPAGLVPLVDAWVRDCLTEREAVQP